MTTSDDKASVSRVYVDLELYTDDAIAKLNNPLPTTQRVVPSVEWLEFLFRVHRPLDRANEFICYHNKFYWRTCVRCRRSPEAAKHWRERLWPKLLALLADASTK